MKMTAYTKKQQTKTIQEYSGKFETANQALGFILVEKYWTPNGSDIFAWLESCLEKLSFSEIGVLAVLAGRRVGNAEHRCLEVQEVLGSGNCLRGLRVLRDPEKGRRSNWRCAKFHLLARGDLW